MTQNTLIEVENISKTYGAGEAVTPVLKSLSLRIDEGEFVAIMGPSGSGKTTLLFAISGMDAVDSGRVIFGGNNISKMSDNEQADFRRRYLGFIFQQPTLLKNLTILDNIILPSLRDNKDRSEVIKKARNLMSDLDVKHLETRSVTHASGGELQRAGICRALMNDPKVVLGDEPTGALNATTADAIMDEVKKIHQAGKTIILVTHDPKVAARASRIIFLKDGEIVYDMKFSDKDGDRRQMVDDVMQKLGV